MSKPKSKNINGKSAKASSSKEGSTLEKKIELSPTSSNVSLDERSEVEKPSAKEKPSTAKNPLATEEPSVTEQPSETKSSSVVEKKPTEKSPATTHKTVENQAPLASQKSSETGTMSVETVYKKSGTGLSIFALLISFVAIGAAAFTWYQFQVVGVQESSRLAIGVNDIGSQVTRISDSVSFLQKTQNKAVTQEQLTTRLLTASVTVDKQLRDIQSEQNVLSQSVSKILDDLDQGANEYVIDEVSQLLKLGNNSVIFSDDISGAINAFTLADTQLKELANPRFSVVRRAINSEIELLKSIELVDTQSALARLGSVSNDIEFMTLENEPPVLEQEPQVIDESVEEETSWRTELAEFWSDVTNSFSIQRVDQPPKPLLAPKERYFLNQNLKLTLSKAEIALLQGRDAFYVASINDAEQWLNDYFDLDDPKVVRALQALSELKEIQISQTLPSVIGSYDLLQSIKGGK